MKFHGFPHGNPSWILKNEGVWGSPKEQFGIHEKLSWVGEGRARYAKVSISSGYNCFYEGHPIKNETFSVAP